MDLTRLLKELVDFKLSLRMVRTWLERSRTLTLIILIAHFKNSHYGKTSKHFWVYVTVVKMLLVLAFVNVELNDDSPFKRVP